MNVVAENHADSLGRQGRQSRDALIAAVIGEGLRDNLQQERDELPDVIQALLRTLADRASGQTAAP